jgi:hypothetical protein
MKLELYSRRLFSLDSTCDHGNQSSKIDKRQAKFFSAEGGSRNRSATLFSPLDYGSKPLKVDTIERLLRQGLRIETLRKAPGNEGLLAG